MLVTLKTLTLVFSSQPNLFDPKKSMKEFPPIKNSLMVVTHALKLAPTLTGPPFMMDSGPIRMSFPITSVQQESSSSQETFKRNASAANRDTLDAPTAGVTTQINFMSVKDMKEN